MKILDVACGGKMFYFDKNNPCVTYMDIRNLSMQLCDGREYSVHPDIIGDFRNIPLPDNCFDMVIFDPPHLLHAGDNSWLSKKYGTLSSGWKQDLHNGFEECFRVLKSNGVLIFKWNEEQIKTAEVLKLSPYKPLLGDKRSKTRWIVFVK